MPVLSLLKTLFSYLPLSRVGGRRGAVECFDLPETLSGGIWASPFPTSPLRTVRAGFLAHGSPVLIFIPSSIEQDLRIPRPVPSLVRRPAPVPLPPVSGITPIIRVLWELCRHETRVW